MPHTRVFAIDKWNDGSIVVNKNDSSKRSTRWPASVLNFCAKRRCTWAEYTTNLNVYFHVLLRYEPDNVTDERV